MMRSGAGGEGGEVGVGAFDGFGVCLPFLVFGQCAVDAGQAGVAALAFAGRDVTVRNAVAQLRSEGWIVSYHGKGSFVRANVDRPTHNHTRALVTQPEGAITDVATDGSTEVCEPSQYRDQATPDLALTSGVAEHSPVFVHDRLLADSTGRRQAHRLYVPMTIAAQVPALEENPFVTPQQLYGILSDAGHALQWPDYVRARVPGPDDVSALHIPDGGLFYVIRRVTRDAGTGTVLAVEETPTSAHDTQVEIPLTATPATAGAERS